MRIILMRHGKPILPCEDLLLSVDFENWINSYNLADLCHSVEPKSEIIKLAQNSNAVLCSSLPRSLMSAKKLGVNKIYCTEYALREMELPWGKLFRVKLKPNYWLVIFRMLWFFGYSNNVESFKQAKLRAEHAAIFIEGIAKTEQSVLFVGHGMLNRFIVKTLKKRGWKVKKKLSSSYWAYGVLESKI